MIHTIKAMYDGGCGSSLRAIAQELGLSRNTVRKYATMPVEDIAAYRDERERSSVADAQARRDRAPRRAPQADLLAEDPPPLGVHPAQMKTPLGQVDADDHRARLRFAMLDHRSAPLPRLTMVLNIAHCARSGLIGGAGRTIPLR